MFRAEYLDGHSAADASVEVMFDDTDFPALTFVSARGVERWPVSSLQVECLPNFVTEVRCANEPLATLVCREEAFREALVHRGVSLRQPMSRPQSRKLGATLFLSATGLLIGAYLSVPALSRAIAQRIPGGVEEKWGAMSDGSFQKDICDPAAHEAVLSSLLASLTLPGEETQGVKVSVVNWSMVNAFAFPGKRIVLTRGLLEKAESPDEVAGVLAHELEHVQRRHVVANLVRSSILSLGWAVTVGDYAGMMVVDPSTMYQLANLRFSRDDEREADEGALARLRAAQFSEEGFRQFFRRLKEKYPNHDDLALLSTHPPLEERMARSSKNEAPSTRPALSAEQWNRLKATCQAQAKEPRFFDEWLEKEAESTD